VVVTPNIYQNGTYQIVVIWEPEGKYKCYGIENRQTGVVEAYISQLARAMQIADQFEQDLKRGFPTTADDIKLFEDTLVAALTGKKKEKPPTGGYGGLNG
jgi:hypothetical protein